MDIEQTIKDNMGLAYMVLHKFNRAHDEDALSRAMEGLWKAAETYDKESGNTFSTYATVCIYNAVGCYLRTLTKKRQLDVMSYDSVMDEENGATFLEVIPGGLSPEEVLVNDELVDILHRSFKEVLDELTNETIRSVVLYWEKTDFKATQKEIAKELGIAQPTVSRGLSSFRYKLRLRMEKYLC